MAQRIKKIYQGIESLPQRISSLIDIQCLVASLRFDEMRTKKNGDEVFFPEEIRCNSFKIEGTI